jgi:hypothetical protein
MKRLLFILAAFGFTFALLAQSVPQKLSYQAIVRNATGKLIQNSNVSVRISILQGSATGTVTYSETHAAGTNENGVVTLEIGNGTPVTGVFSDINWATGIYYLKTETDPTGGTNYTISGTSQLLSVPYSLYSQVAGNGFSGDYNDLTNKPVTDGSETKIQPGQGITVTGNGTTATPYVIHSSMDGSETKISGGNNVTVTGSGTSTSPYVVNASPVYPPRITLVESQVWNTPGWVTKIKVELWGAAGGGGGAGAYSYSYWLNDGGSGGSGGYSMKEMFITTPQSFNVIIGNAGTAGVNAEYNYPNYYTGDTDGGDGGDSWFGSLMKAAGGTGGKRGSYSTNTVHGVQGTDNSGDVTGYSEDPQSVFLNKWTWLVRSYLSERNLTSKPGTGGSLSGYSGPVLPTAGEGGCAVITLFE